MIRPNAIVESDHHWVGEFNLHSVLRLCGRVNWTDGQRQGDNLYMDCQSRLSFDVSGLSVEGASSE